MNERHYLLNSHGGDKEPRVSTLTRSAVMLFTVVVLSHSSSFAMSHSTLESAVAYAHGVMSASGDALDVVILRTVNNAAKVIKRYRQDAN
jgi:hypothetical protein